MKYLMVGRSMDENLFRGYQVLSRAAVLSNAELKRRKVKAHGESGSELN